MKPRIYKALFSALKEELKERGYSMSDVETLLRSYSWFLSEHSLLRVLLRSRMSINECYQSLDFLVRRHEVLARKIRSSSIVLDVGCGLGIRVCLLAKKNCLVYGVDIEEDAIEVAKRLSKMLKVEKLCTFQKSVSNTLPFDTSAFDYVILSWTLRDIRLEDCEPLLLECMCILNSNGKILILDPESQLNFEQVHQMMSNYTQREYKEKSFQSFMIMEPFQTPYS